MPVKFPATPEDDISVILTFLPNAAEAGRYTRAEGTAAVHHFIGYAIGQVMGNNEPLYAGAKVESCTATEFKEGLEQLQSPVFRAAVEGASIKGAFPWMKVITFAIQLLQDLWLNKA